MRLTIEIAAAALLLFCISATSAAFAAGKAGKSADGLSCSFSVPANASPAARRPPPAARRSSANAAESFTRTTVGTSCCRRCEIADLVRLFQDQPDFTVAPIAEVARSIDAIVIGQFLDTCADDVGCNRPS